MRLPVLGAWKAAASREIQLCREWLLGDNGGKATGIHFSPYCERGTQLGTFYLQHDSQIPHLQFTSVSSSSSLQPGAQGEGKNRLFRSSQTGDFRVPDTFPPLWTPVFCLAFVHSAVSNKVSADIRDAINKKITFGWMWWCMPAILTAWEAEAGWCL